jgi:hypothetical protein
MIKSRLFRTKFKTTEALPAILGELKQYQLVENIEMEV